MKRIYSYLTLLLLALAPLALTGCDDGDDWYDDYDWFDNPYNDGQDDLVLMAQTLNGAWTGSLTNEYTENGTRYQTSMYVDFTFVQYTSSSNNGRGYETDYAQRTYDDGTPMYDSDGNPVYDTRTLQFKWYIDPRTYNIYVEYSGSGMRYVLDSRGNSQTSGFFLGYDDRERKDLFNGVMEGVNNDELIYFDCERVTSSDAPAMGKAASRATYDAKAARSGGRTFGKALATKRAPEAGVAVKPRKW